MPTMSQDVAYVHATADYKVILSYFKVKLWHKMNGRTEGKAHMYSEAHTLPESGASPKSSARSSLSLTWQEEEILTPSRTASAGRGR